MSYFVAVAGGGALVREGFADRGYMTLAAAVAERLAAWECELGGIPLVIVDQGGDVVHPCAACDGYGKRFGETCGTCGGRGVSCTDCVLDAQRFQGAGP